jgi:DNA-binding transcriptional ArsR family regulator
LYKARLGSLWRMSAGAALAALAEPRRRQILLLVRDQPRSVNEIAAQFEITQQAVSQHLQVLKDAGLVAVRPVGQRRLYAVRVEGLQEVRQFLADLWPSSLENLKQAIESEQPDGS